MSTIRPTYLIALPVDGKFILLPPKAGSGSGQGVSGYWPSTKHRGDVRAAVLGCGLERQESPLRLAKSGPVVLSPSVIKYEMD
jgi:hypothetical protein